jgi:hypothetical protein
LRYFFLRSGRFVFATGFCPATLLLNIYIDQRGDWEAFIAGSSASANPSSTCCYQNTTVVLNTDLYFYRRNEDPAYAGAKN